MPRPARPTTFASLLASQPKPQPLNETDRDETIPPFAEVPAGRVEESDVLPKPASVGRKPMTLQESEEPDKEPAETEDPSSTEREADAAPVAEDSLPVTNPEAALPTGHELLEADAEPSVAKTQRDQSETSSISMPLSTQGEGSELVESSERGSDTSGETQKAKSPGSPAVEEPSADSAGSERAATKSPATPSSSDPSTKERPLSSVAALEIGEGAGMSPEDVEPDDSVEIDAEMLKRINKDASDVSRSAVAVPQPTVNQGKTGETTISTKSNELENELETPAEGASDTESDDDGALPERRSSQERENRQFTQGRDTEPARPSTTEPARVVRSARETELTSEEFGEKRVENTEEAGDDADGTSTAQEKNRMAEPQNKPTNPSSVSDPLSGDSARIETTRDGKEPAATMVTSAQEVSAARPVVRAEAGSVVTVPSTYEAAIANAERLSGMIVRESAVLRQSGAETMTAILRPDEHTEMVVSMRKIDGTMEATIKVERGDFGSLGQQWSHLQERLAQQNVRLAPLEDSAPRFDGGTREDDPRSGNPGHADDNPSHTRRAANVRPGGGAAVKTASTKHADDVPQASDSPGRWETWA